MTGTAPESSGGISNMGGRNNSDNVASKRNELESLQQALDKLSLPKDASMGGETDRFRACITECYTGATVWPRRRSSSERSISLKGRQRVVAYAALTRKQDFWVSEEAIPQQIELIGIHLDGLEKEQRAITTKLNRLKKEMEPIEKDISSLEKKLRKIYQRKKGAHARIFEQRKQRDEVNAHHHEYLSVLKNDRELAEQRDAAALEELSIS
ncbi:hypothetical protein L1049_025093 [Liquidambar formosana]|uniref:Uncharacterized protein n=1 Tax=Liquidambar formosana TaxID=63359 RepID=A0AAP0X094_LIQFO